MIISSRVEKYKGKDWGCEGADIPLLPNASGADDDDMDDVFQGYGYVNAHQIGYDGTGNYEDVKDELDAGRPVLRV